MLWNIDAKNVKIIFQADDLLCSYGSQAGGLVVLK